MRSFILALLLLLLIAPTALSQVPDDKLIVLGQGIGKWKLGSTTEDIAAMNGPGSDGPAFGDDFQPGWMDLEWPSLGLRAGHRRGANRIEYLSLGYGLRGDVSLIASFKTAEGVGMSSALSAVAGAYGNPTVRTIPSTIVGVARLIYDEKGIAFTMLQMTLVFEIVVFPPGAAKTIWKF